VSARSFRALALLVSCASLVACASAPKLPPPPRSPTPVAWPAPLTSDSPPRVTLDAPFRDHVPEPGPPVVFHAPHVESFALSCGARVLFVERHELPLVSLRVVARSGAGDMGLRPGEAAFLGAMIEQGTDTKNALAISDAFLAMGAQHASWVDWDAGQITIESLVSQLDRAIDLLADLAQHASFPQEEIDRLAARWVGSIRASLQSGPAEATNATAAALYGRAHPYGHSLYGKPDDVTHATRDELVKAWRRAFNPANVTIVVAGDVTKDALLAKLNAAFGSWATREKASHAPLPAPKPMAARLVLVDRPGASQSQVSIAEAGVPFAAPDRDAVAVMNAILGGMFSSHVNLNLREAHAYTYDARTRFELRRGAGPFTAGGAIAAKDTGAAIGEVLREIVGMQTTEVSAEELADAKELLALGLPARFETLGDATGAVADLAIYDLPLEEYATRAKRLTAVTAAEVRRVAEAHLHPAKMKVVIVGDLRVVTPTLAPLKLGGPAVLDGYGDPAAR
jgi:zinc protease